MSFTVPASARLDADECSEMERRLAEAEVYLQILLARRARSHHRLNQFARKVLEQRLEAAEDWVRMDPLDWDRLQAILLPETFGRPIRDWGLPALQDWTRLCRELLPEAHDSSGAPRATDELTGTAGKEAVLSMRARMRLELFGEGDAADSDDVALYSDDVAANGKVAPSHVADRAVERLVVALKGEGRFSVETPPPDMDPSWRRPCLEGLRAGVLPQVVEDLKVATVQGCTVGPKDGEVTAAALPPAPDAAVPDTSAAVTPDSAGHFEMPLAARLDLLQRCLWHGVERCGGDCALDGEREKKPRQSKQPKPQTEAPRWTQRRWWPEAG